MAILDALAWFQMRKQVDQYTSADVSQLCACVLTNVCITGYKRM